MSLRGEINDDIYSQIIDLQEKLKQSEAEKNRLEEMFKVLLKTFKEEEDMRKKYLEVRYHSFLDDCAKRNYRNGKILRSIERVENAANVLYAKTERLKLLRNHYEVYLGRIIPTWRQNNSIQYSPNQLPSLQKMEWHRQSQLTPEEITEQLRGSYSTVRPSVKNRSASYSDQNFAVDYFPRNTPERERFSNKFPNNASYFNRDKMNQTSNDPDTWEKLMYNRERDRKSPENFDVQMSDFGRIKPTKPLLRVEEVNYDEGSVMKGLETALHRKLVLDDTWEPAKNRDFRERTNESTEDDSIRDVGYLKRADPTLNESYLNKFSKLIWVPPLEKRQSRTGETYKNGVEEYVKDRPVITREPIEMKKPEFIVGKLHPEATLKFEHFNNPSESESSPSQNVKQDNFFIQRPISPSDGSQEPEIVKIKITESGPQNRWNLLKHKNSINKLKETLFFEEGYDHQAIENKKLLDNVIRSSENSYKNEVEKELKQQHENESPRIVSMERHNGVQQEVPLSSEVDSVPNKNLSGNEEIPSDEKNINTQYEEHSMTQNTQYKEEEGGYPQKDEICVSNGETYDDNEETYPESYFEQPPKPDYSRDIVSNVILEEDESEVYANENVPEDPQKIQNEYSEFDSGNVSNNNAEYNMNETGQIGGNEIQYQNLGPDSGVGAYANSTDYNDIPQQYIYENQEYDQSNGYNNIEQYQTVNAEQSEYYQSQDLGNYSGEAIEQPYENVYNQQQGLENNPAAEQYGQNYQEQYNEGEMIPNGNYYNQEEYDGTYYESQLHQNSDYPQNEEQENPDMLQGEELGNNQVEADEYGNESKNLPLRQSTLAQFLESDSESFQMEHGSTAANEDSDFDFSISQKQ